MQIIGKIFTLMVEWLKYYLKTESKPIPLKVSENLPRKSMRILINPEFIHGKRQQRAEFIYENFWCKNVSCWFFTNSFIQIEGLRLWEAAWRTDCLKKRKEKNCNKTSPPKLAISSCTELRISMGICWGCWDYLHGMEMTVSLALEMANSKSKWVMG